MKGWITVKLLCETAESIELDKLGIYIEDKNLIYRPYRIQISQIGSIGLCVDTGGSFLNICGKNAETKESPDKIWDMITKVSVNV